MSRGGVASLKCVASYGLTNKKNQEMGNASAEMGEE
jgi:hypothetical protein